MMETSPPGIGPPDIASEVENMSINIVSDNYCDPNFWAAVRENLVSLDHSVRKQALYKFAKAIETLKLQKEKPDDSLKVPFLCEKVHSSNVPMKTVEANFFLIYDALEEVQKHLIIPALSHLHSLIRANEEHESCGKCFDTVWLRVIFQRLLRHENNFIVKFGVCEVSCIRLSLFDEGFLELLLSVLNNTYLYENDDIEKEPPIVTRLAMLFQRAEEADDELTRKFLLKMSTLSWGPVAMFHVLRSLNLALCSRRSEKNVLDKETLLSVQKLVQLSLTMHSKMLRMASQLELLLLITNYSKRCLHLESLGFTLSTFSGQEVLKRKNYAWNRICDWLGEALQSDEASNFVQRNCDRILHSQENDVLEISVPALALMITLLFDSKLVLQTQSCLALQSLIAFLDTFIDFDIRLYANKLLTNRIVTLIGSLLHYLKTTNDEISQILSPYRNELVKYLLKVLKRPPKNFYFDEVKQVLDLFKAVFGPSLQVMCNAQYLVDIDIFHETAEDILRNVYKFYNMQHYFALNIIYILNDIIPWPRLLIENSFLDIQCLLEDQEKWLNITGKVASKWYKLFAMLFVQNLRSRPKNIWCEGIDVIEIAARILDNCDEEALSYVTSLLDIITKEYYQEMEKNSTPPPEDKLISLKSSMKNCWKKILFESNKTNAYWKAVRGMCLALMSPHFLAMEGAQKILDEFSEEIMKQGEKAPALRKCLVSAAVNLPAKAMIPFTKHLIACLTHGSTPRLDQRIETQSCFYIEKKYAKEYQEEFGVTNCDIDATIRATAASVLHYALGDRKYGAVVLPPLLEKLTTNRCKRYFRNSLFHRIKNRILQSLLIVQPNLDKECLTKLHDVLSDLLINESNQHSVRLMMEWILIRIYLKYPDLQKKLWTTFEKAIEERPSTTRSLATITYHVVKNLSGQHLLKFATQAMTYIIPCCLGQQFSMRLYNQVIFVKIYNLLQETHGFEVISSYEILYKAALQSLQVGNLLKNATDMEGDFFFTSFHPKRSYSIETIYYELPRLTTLAKDEWITPEVFEAVNFPETNIRSLKIRNPDSSLSRATVPPYILKSTDSEPNAIVDVDTSNSLSDIQKKPSPWKSYTPIESEVEEISTLREKVIDQNGITVVASLVDRIPNLGGLARTCEILGAKELVISTLAHVKNKEFQGLSVSAEKWITVIEVATHELENYLLEKKEAGYTLVGVEQTANSTSLFNVKFKKNTVLLLGNEKSGIPANLIPLMDQCVQIPQLGIIRSLNVHVTGAICLWEYAKQHNFKEG